MAHRRSWTAAAGGMAALFFAPAAGRGLTTSSRAVGDAKYLGCFHDNKKDRVLGDRTDSSDMTTEVHEAGHIRACRLPPTVVSGVAAGRPDSCCEMSGKILKKMCEIRYGVLPKCYNMTIAHGSRLQCFRVERDARDGERPLSGSAHRPPQQKNNASYRRFLYRRFFLLGQV